MSSQFGVGVYEWDDHLQDYVKEIEIYYPGLLGQVRDYLEVYGYYKTYDATDRNKLFNYRSFERVLSGVIQTIDNEIDDCRNDIENAVVYSPQDIDEKDRAVDECRELLELIEESDVVVGKLSGMMALADAFSFDAGREDKRYFGFILA